VSRISSARDHACNGVSFEVEFVDGGFSTDEINVRIGHLDVGSVMERVIANKPPTVKETIVISQPAET
jgi:hypothetical protein